MSGIIKDVNWFQTGVDGPTGNTFRLGNRPSKQTMENLTASFINKVDDPAKEATNGSEGTTDQIGYAIVNPGTIPTDFVAVPNPMGGADISVPKIVVPSQLVSNSRIHFGDWKGISAANDFALTNYENTAIVTNTFNPETPKYRVVTTYTDSGVESKHVELKGVLHVDMTGGAKAETLIVAVLTPAEFAPSFLRLVQGIGYTTDTTTMPNTNTITAIPFMFLFTPDKKIFISLTNVISINEATFGAKFTFVISLDNISFQI